MIKSFSLSCGLRREEESEIVASVRTDTEQIGEGEKMADKKLLLFILLFLLMALIGGSSARAAQVPNSIDEAIAIINNAIDEAIALVREAIDGDPNQADEAINNANSLIRDAVDEATTLIQETAVEEEIEEDIASAEERINSDIQEKIETVARRLFENKTFGPNEIDFAGSIVAGMVSAYELIGDNSYKISAELAGENILSAASGNFKGDEVFAIARLSQICGTQCSDLWWTILCDFYRNVQNGVGGTEGYIFQLASAGPSTAVFNLAYYVVTAYYVDAADKEIWRRELVNCLIQIDDDTSDSPVMVLGIATWALTLTGGLDNTLLDPNQTGATCWHKKKLKDLPAMLLKHQVPADALYAGRFFRHFDYGGDVSSYLSGCDIEDTICATLGLIGACQNSPEPEIEEAIIAATQAIVEMIGPNGELYHHQLECQCLDIYRLLAAEILQVFRELYIAGDFVL